MLESPTRRGAAMPQVEQQVTWSEIAKPAVRGVRTRAERLGMFALGTLGAGTWFLIGLLEGVCNGSSLGALKWGFLAMTPIGLTAGLVGGSWAGGGVTAVPMGLRFEGGTLVLSGAARL